MAARECAHQLRSDGQPVRPGLQADLFPQRCPAGQPSVQARQSFRGKGGEGVAEIPGWLSPSVSGRSACPRHRGNRPSLSARQPPHCTATGVHGSGLRSEKVPLPSRRLGLCRRPRPLTRLPLCCRSLSIAIDASTKRGRLITKQAGATWATEIRSAREEKGRAAERDTGTLTKHANRRHGTSSSLSSSPSRPAQHVGRLLLTERVQPQEGLKVTTRGGNQRRNYQTATTNGATTNGDMQWRQPKVLLRH